MTTATLLRKTRSTRPVAMFAWVNLGFFILVVLWGAVVRATGSGGGCGSGWPLCNGDFIPHHPRLATMIEFAHRSTSGACTMLRAALVVWTFRATPKRHPARVAVVGSAVLLVTEALLGAVLVLRHYVEGNLSTGRVITQAVHFTNTMFFMGALALTAWALGQSWPNGRPRVAPGRAGLALLSLAAAVVVGATGALAALADTLFPSASLRAGLAADLAAGSPWLLHIRSLHPLSALFAAACVGFLMLRAWLSQRTAVLWVGGLLGAQLVLGTLDLLLLAPVWMQVLHLLGADLFWVALVILAAAWAYPHDGRAQAQAT